MIVFFILSGFVLPLSWFKNRRPSSIFGAAFRRYFRLMIPMFFVLSFYYFVAKMDFPTNPKTFEKTKKKQFPHLVFDGLIGVWFMNFDYSQATWTLSVEVFASYWVFLLAFVVINYRGRFWVYGLIFLFLSVPRITDAYHYTNYGFDSKFHVKHDQFFDKAIRESIPTFFIGVLFCDLEHDQKVRRLDALRELPWYFKIPINLSLVIMFFIYASVAEDSEDHYRPEDMRTYDAMVTGNYKIGFPVCMHIAALSIFLLALISEWFQWFLNLPPIQFLGKISYTFYLIHNLFIEWPQYETKKAFEDSGTSANMAVLYVFLIYTPILILFSWLLEWAVDTPAKNWSNKIDIEARQKGENKSTFCEFVVKSWEFWCLLGWLSLVLVVTEVY